MSLRNCFQANIGDLVLLSSNDVDRVGLVGYVRAYSNRKVDLTNKAIFCEKDQTMRETGLLDTHTGERRYSSNLHMWNSYQILRKVIISRNRHDFIKLRS